ncbi:hypothetical protein TTHERM_000647238 (macronuclear) [Tetrahymena thermophila SB210]|uniref:Uncharacterized protein n=1 Tax=Tetrahymena thermophila (strain SB210) TaxID=312017 RepID=W7XBN0_TETTS|nr:hypothetical protein TTHERM_000647238 [Tetrahymena thermophila SB210]EWS71086.1 hypothetical protein TTHERM_000647238 [Tetrahymena thermophila SB210]|eukprot:XP_012656385.1 hypothetical protein TTHERM_000647238 [Tetrahymena thermophila SB210]
MPNINTLSKVSTHDIAFLALNAKGLGLKRQTNSISNFNIVNTIINSLLLLQFFQSQTLNNNCKGNEQISFHLTQYFTLIKIKSTEI